MLDFDEAPQGRRSAISTSCRWCCRTPTAARCSTSPTPMRSRCARRSRTRRAVLWSTSRNELWRKGETSGDVLDLVEVRVNCEQNSLLYRVRPRAGGSVPHARRRRPQPPGLLLPASGQRGCDARVRLTYAGRDSLHAQSSHGSSASMSLRSTVAPPQMRRPGGRVAVAKRRRARRPPSRAAPRGS